MMDNHFLKQPTFHYEIIGHCNLSNAETECLYILHIAVYLKGIAPFKLVEN